MTGMRSLLLPLTLALALATPVAAAEVTVGDKIPNLSFKDSHYVARSLDDFKGRKAFVFVFVVRGCPLVPKYLPTLDRLEKQYRTRGVQFLAVNVSPEDTITEAAAQLVEAGVAFPVVKDFEARCADALGVTRTPEVAVLDGERRLRYRGRIDDQYRPGGIARAEPSRHDLREALDEVLAGKEVSVPKTEVDGCTLTRADDLAADPGITFAQHVNPILTKHCVACHRPGGEAPFALLTYEQVRTRGKMIAEVVREGRMPPWFAAPGHDRIVNQRVLTARERDLLATWVRSGMAAGDRLASPPPEDRPPVAWRIGEPDLVLKTRAVNLPSTGQVPDRYLVLPYYFAEDTWVQGLGRSCPRMPTSSVRPRWSPSPWARAFGQKTCWRASVQAANHCNWRRAWPCAFRRTPSWPCKSISSPPASHSKARSLSGSVSLGVRSTRNCATSRFSNPI